MAKPEGGRQTRRWLGAGCWSVRSAAAVANQRAHSLKARRTLARPWRSRTRPMAARPFKSSTTPRCLAMAVRRSAAAARTKARRPRRKWLRRGGRLLAACAAPDGDAWLVCAIEGCAADADCEQPGVCEAQVVRAAAQAPADPSTAREATCASLSPPTEPGAASRRVIDPPAMPTPIASRATAPCPTAPSLACARLAKTKTHVLRTPIASPRNLHRQHLHRRDLRQLLCNAS